MQGPRKALSVYCIAASCFIDRRCVIESGSTLGRRSLDSKHNYSNRHLHIRGQYCMGKGNFAHFFMPPEWNSGYLVFVLSVCLLLCDSVAKIFNLGHNYGNVRDRDFIFGMHIQLMKHFKWHQGRWPCDLDRDLYTGNSQFGTLLLPGGICVSQTHLFFFSNCRIIKWTRKISPICICITQCKNFHLCSSTSTWNLIIFISRIVILYIYFSPHGDI